MISIRSTGGVRIRPLRLLIPLVLTIMLLCSCATDTAPVSAPVQQTTWSWELLANGTARITGCSTSDSVLVLPEQLDGVVISAVGDDVFSGNHYIASVILPDSIVSVGNRAFMNCTGLRSINLGSVTVIGAQAFSGCQFLSRAEMSTQLFLIGKGAFEKCCAFEQLVLPGTLSTIPENAFSGCTKLKNIVIAEGVSLIGNYAFSGCTALSSVSLPSSLECIGQYAFGGCTALESVSSCAAFIEDHAFSGSGITSLTLENGTVSIGIGAFENCTALMQAVMPDSLRDIGQNAFDGCGALERINIPGTVITIGRSAFDGCDELTITAPVPSVGQLYAEAYETAFEPLPTDESDTPDSPDDEGTE